MGYEAAEQKLCNYMSDLGVQPLDGKRPARTAEEASEVDALELRAGERKQEVETLQDQLSAESTDCANVEAEKAKLESSIQALLTQEHGLVSQAKCAATASLDDAHNAMHQLHMLFDIEGVSLHKMTYNEIVVGLCERHRIRFVCDGDMVVEATIGLFASGESLDEFHRGLVEDAELEELAASVCGRPRYLIPQVLNELGFRLGRCNDLMDEIDSMQRSLKLLVDRRRGSVEVTVCSLPQNRKLQATFSELSYGYPHGDMRIDVTHCVGDVSAETLQELSRDQTMGQYGRLSNICKRMVERVCEVVVN